MRNPLDTAFAEHLALLLGRVPIGVYFVIAGVGKFRGGVESFVNKNSGSIPDWFPHPLGLGYLYLVPFAEVLTGAALVLGIFARPAALIMTLMLISFMIAVTGVTDPKLPFHPNVIYAGLTFLLAVFGGGAFGAGNMLPGGASTPAKSK